MPRLDILLQGLGRSEEAVVSQKQAVRLSPDFAEAHNNLGYLLAAQGRLAEAVPHYEEALRLNPGDAKALDNLRQARDELGRRPGGGTPP